MQNINAVINKEHEYDSLCNIFDALLQEQHVTEARVGIAELHVLNEHPLNLNKYQNINTGGWRNARESFKLMIKRALRIIKSLVNTKSQIEPENLPEKTDVLIISHLLNESFLYKDEDFYYGELAAELQKKDISCIFALRNHTGKKIKKVIRHVTGVRIVLEDILPWNIEIKVRKELSQEAMRLRRKARISKGPIKNIYNFAANKAYSIESIRNIGLYFQIKRLVRIVRPKAILVTYEGHAWERLAFAAARKVIPNIKCIGYHHTILFPRQHAIKRKIHDRFDPDVIMTAGSITREILIKEHSYTSTKIIVYGTHRYSEIDNTLASRKFNQKNCYILVLPDGTLSECIKIISFTFRLAEDMPKIKFIIRLHPVISYSAIYKKNKKLKALPPNIELSNKDIYHDFVKCKWAIYRGSSAAIYAVTAGLRPIYLAEDGELSIDPLYQLKMWRRVAYTPADVKKIVEDDRSAKGASIEEEWKHAKIFTECYFKKVNINSLINAIEV